MTEHVPGQGPAPDPSETGEREGSGRLRGATGRELRERREALGWDLGEIAEVLCIRRLYLEALEDGDYGALPGHAYAVGFVRSYARHLGLDGDSAARQFKIEVAGERPTARLDFPEPLAESRIPTGAIVLVTVLLAATVYGVWYYLNARDLSFADMVPEVPSRFVADTDAELPAPEAPARAGAGGTASEAPAPMPVAEAAPAEAVGQGGDGSAPPAVEPAPPLESGPAATGEPGPADAQPSASAAEQPRPEAPAPTSPPSRNVAEAEADERASAPPVRPTAVPPEPPAHLPRIEIRAVADSWVQVRDADGSLLMTRIMTPGSSYVVPAEQGLTLMTGNAGGLEILVDGAPIPPLGPFGAVRRDVALDPERLKSGTAIGR